ncbi:MAG TPA: flagellar filament capping protein FliD [Acidimicrobiales bacterium]|nr:flagellar filament capping protein FliD [Acidimicrobiales bacterium]
MTNVAGTTSSAAAPLLVNGIVSGINTTQVIQALLQAYQAPITNLQNEQTSLSNQSGDYRTLNSDFQSLQTAAGALNTASAWNLMTATSQNTAVATATASAGATPATLGFTVSALAQGNVLLSSGSVTSPAATVSSGASVLAATGGAALGFSGLAGAGALTIGSHTITVSQSSAAATLLGGVPGASTTITGGTNDTLTLDVGGAPKTLTLAAGSYSASGLVAAVNAAAASAGAAVTASLSENGSLQLSTDEQGSAATLGATGGNGLSTLGLTSGASATGSDAVVAVDGTSTTLSAINPGGTVTLNAPSGTISAAVATQPGVSGALVSAGKAQAALVSTGNGSLSSLVSNLNAAGLGLTATAVQEASGHYRLQVTSDATGLGGAVSVDSAPLSGGSLGSLSTITAAADAAVTVGGVNGYTLQSSTNTFTNLLQGASVTVASLGTTTVTVAPDASGEANSVSTLVSAANQALSDISTLAGYNATTKTGGPLMGSAVVSALQQSILSTFATAAGTSGLGSATAVGITLTQTGTITFDQNAFEKAYAQNPSAVAALFTAGGTFSPASPSNAGQVSLVYGDPSTATGTYAVSLTQSAAPASDLGAVLSGGTVTAGENLTVTANGASAQYSVSAGQSLDQVATGLNQLFAANGLSLSAFVSGGDQLQVQSAGFGSGATFSVTSDSTAPGTTGLGGATANTPATFTGTDVAGSINGVLATGTGQELISPSKDPTLHGLTLQVTTTGVSSPTALGNFTYTPGLAQQLLTISKSASDAATGSLSDAIKGLSDQSTGLNSQIANYQRLEQEQQTLLTKQFAQMEQTLGSVKNEGAALTSQISKLTGF